MSNSLDNGNGLNDLLKEEKDKEIERLRQEAIEMVRTQEYGKQLEIEEESLIPEVDENGEPTEDEMTRFFQETVGYGEEQMPKTAVSVYLEKVMIDHQRGEITSREIVSSFGCLNPEVELDINEDFTTVMLNFGSPSDEDIRNLMAELEKYHDLNEQEENDDTIYMMTMILMPRAYDGRMFATFMAPVFTGLIAEKPMALPKNITLIYESVDANIYADPNFDIDPYIDEVLERAQAFA